MTLATRKASQCHGAIGSEGHCFSVEDRHFSGQDASQPESIAG